MCCKCCCECAGWMVNINPVFCRPTCCCPQGKTTRKQEEQYHTIDKLPNTVEMTRDAPLEF